MKVDRPVAAENTLGNLPEWMHCHADREEGARVAPRSIEGSGPLKPTPAKACNAGETVKIEGHGPS